jgi:hypothetical protein
MPGQNSGEMVMIGAVIAVAALVAFIFVVTIQSRRAADPSNTSVVDIDDLASLVALDATGAFVLNIYRQSGNPHADGQVFETVSIRINTRDKLDVSRALFDHRGRAEGKKVGGFEIIRVAG